MNKELDERRRQVVESMLAIRSLSRGALSEQYVERTRDGKAIGELRGPYFVLSRHERGHTVGSRVRKKDVERARADLGRYSKFVSLCEEFVEITEQLGRLERDKAVVEEAEKKDRNRGGRQGRGSPVRNAGIVPGRA